MNKDIEKYLSKFKLKEPPQEIKRKIISNASRHWSEEENDPELSPGLRMAVKIFFTAAAVVPVAILVLNSISFSRPEINTDKHKFEMEQLIALGIPKNKAEMMLVFKKVKKENFKLSRKYLQMDDRT